MLRYIAIGLLLLTQSAYSAPNYQYSLQDSAGNTLTETSFPTQYQMIAFGFTHCPDVCPTTLYEFKEVMANIHNPEILQPIFITIDPKRDNFDLLEQYTGYFDTRILPLGGTREQIDHAVENFNASYGYQIDGQKINPDALPDDGAYTVYHSTLIYLLNPQGELIDVFDYQTGSKQLLQGIEANIAEAQKQHEQ